MDTKSYALVQKSFWSVHKYFFYLLIFIFSLPVFLICMQRSINVYDEGLILFGAQRVLNGDIIHRDFYTNYGPAQFYVLALLFKIFSPSVLVERIWDSGVRSAIVLLVFWLVSQVASRKLAWMTALASMVWLAALGFHASPMFPVIATTLAGVVCLLPILNGSKSAWRLLAAGVCAGVVGLFRYDMGLFVFSGEALVLGTSVLSRTRRFGPAIWVLLPFGVGLALVALPVAGTYLTTHVLGDMLLDVVLLAGRSYATMRSLPFPGLAALRSDSLEIGTYIPIAISAVAALAILSDVRQHSKRQSFWPMVLVLVLTMAFMAKAYVRISVSHMTMALIMALVLLALLMDTRQKQSPILRVAMLVVFAATLYGTLMAGLLVSWQAQRNLAWVEQGEACRIQAGLKRMRCFTVDQSEMMAMTYVQDVTAPGAAIFVGLGRHDKILVNNIAFYFLADRVSVTKWHHMDPGVQTTEPVQREMITELQVKAPSYVILEASWDNAHEPNGSAVSSGVTILDDYIHANFAPVAAFGDVLVLKAQATPLPTKQ